MSARAWSWCSALLSLLFLLRGGSCDDLVYVDTAEELQAALAVGTPHVRIISHIYVDADLAVPQPSDALGAYLPSVFQISSETRSITGRCMDAPEDAASAVELDEWVEGMCLVVVPKHGAFFAERLGSVLWVHNLHVLAVGTPAEPEPTRTAISVAATQDDALFYITYVNLEAQADGGAGLQQLQLLRTESGGARIDVLALGLSFVSTDNSTDKAPLVFDNDSNGTVSLLQCTHFQGTSRIEFDSDLRLDGISIDSDADVINVGCICVPGGDQNRVYVDSLHAISVDNSGDSLVKVLPLAEAEPEQRQTSGLSPFLTDHDAVFLDLVTEVEGVLDGNDTLDWPPAVGPSFGPAGAERPKPDAKDGSGSPVSIGLIAGVTAAVVCLAFAGVGFTVYFVTSRNRDQREAAKAPPYPFPLGYPHWQPGYVPPYVTYGPPQGMYGPAGAVPITNGPWAQPYSSTGGSYGGSNGRQLYDPPARGEVVSATDLQGAPVSHWQMGSESIAMASSNSSKAANTASSTHTRGVSSKPPQAEWITMYPTTWGPAHSHVGTPPTLTASGSRSGPDSGPVQLLSDTLDRLHSDSQKLAGRWTVLSREHRRVGGQGLVQSVRDEERQEDQVVKFFFDHMTFEREALLYAQSSMSDMMAAVVHCEPAGRHCPVIGVLPAWIVLERGSSLSDWAQARKPDIWTSAQVLSQVLENLARMHSRRLVHRDIKPGNILWREKVKAWTLIDFGCVAAAGQEAALTFSLPYAAPEVISTYEEKRMSMIASTALDMWSIGVVIYQLLTEQTLFVCGTSPEEIRDQLMGRTPLPWDNPKDEANRVNLAKLGFLKSAVLKCLSRDPADRPTAQEMLQQLNDSFRLVHSSAGDLSAEV